MDVRNLSDGWYLIGYLDQPHLDQVIRVWSGRAFDECNKFATVHSNPTVVMRIAE